MNSREKTGFTLAEVLITLSIIGVVAALTIPSLVRNHQEAAWRAAWKKKFSEISQAYMRARAEQGDDIGMTINSNLTPLKPYLKIVKSCGWQDNGTCTCWNKSMSYLNGGTSTACGNSSFIMADGSLLRVTDPGWGDCEGYGGACAIYNLDVNGFKGPNTMGKDIYVLVFFPEAVRAGRIHWTGRLFDTCIQPPEAGWDSEDNTGAGCSLKYLKE